MTFRFLAASALPRGRVFALLALNLRYQFFLHTEAVGRLGPLEWVFNTPAHHRLHHASNEACLDRNYGGVLILFDRMFGTLAKGEPNELAIWEIDNAAGTATLRTPETRLGRIALPLAPMLGCFGVAPARGASARSRPRARSVKARQAGRGAQAAQLLAG